MKAIQQFSRKSWLMCLVCVCVLTGMGVVPTHGQASSSPQNNTSKKDAPPPVTGQKEEPPLIGGEVTKVTLPVTVTDKDDRFITALTKNDFEVFENDKRQNFEFQAATDLPLYIAVLIDTSASVKGKLKFEKEATISFLQTVIRRRKDQAMVVTFDSTVQLRQDFTDNTEQLGKAISEVKASGTTSLFDAVYRVCQEKMYNVPTPRKVIVVLSDGEDTSSKHTVEQAIDIAQRSEVVVYAISTKGAGFFGVSAGQVLNEQDEDLQRLCQETGGEITFPSKVLDLERAFQRYDKQARQYYLLSYEPENPSLPGYRKIHVKLVNLKGLNVRTRKGYTVAKR